MTDPTPTIPQAPPQGLTDAQLLELAEKELCIDDMQDAHEEHYPIEVVTDGLIAYARAAIAADRAARPTPTPEALQAAYAAWFKAEQGIPPSPAAARTAAAFASAVLRGEMKPPQEVQ